MNRTGASKRLAKRILAAVLATETARDAIRAAIPAERHSAWNGIVNFNSPESILSSHSHTMENRLRSDIIFISSRFRSGSTALWNAMRQLEDVVAYYEPFNERRFFDKRTRGQHVDPTHLGVDDYSIEYDATSGLDSLYNEDWIRHDLLMGADAWNPKMSRYIELLIESAKGRPVLQFNRVDFRLPWLRFNFPNAKLVHLWRGVREQWCSTLRTLDEFPKDAAYEEFTDHFYLLPWSKDLRRSMPFLATADGEHPYRLFYLIWKTSWLFGQRYAHTSIEFERMILEPDKTLHSLAFDLELGDEAAARMAATISSPRKERWRSYAEPAWFEEHEQACEQTLNEFLIRPMDSVL